MKIIVLTGAPATGKSSLAIAISKRTKIQYISKDEIKVTLFEKHGFTNHDEKKKLSLLSEELLIKEIANKIIHDEDIIVDNNFKTFNALRDIVIEQKSEVEIYCIYCYADSRILARRYNDRNASGNRHPALYTLNQFPIIEGVSFFHPIIDAGDVERIQQNVKEKTIGQNILELNTDCLEKNFDDMCDSIIEFCHL